MTDRELLEPIALFLAEKLEDLPGDANGTLYYSSAQELRIQADALQRLTHQIEQIKGIESGEMADLRQYQREYNELRKVIDNGSESATHATALYKVIERENEIDRLTAERDALVAAKDGAYLERNQLVALLSKVFPAGKKQTAIEGWSEDWHGCVYIDLPTGQASWHYHDSQAYLFDHLPEYQGVWDGHTTDEKYERIAAIKGAGK